MCAFHRHFDTEDTGPAYTQMKPSTPLEGPWAHTAFTKLKGKKYSTVVSLPRAVHSNSILLWPSMTSTVLNLALFL